MKINLKKIPLKPGVYVYKNKLGEILYIGKAKKLRSRIASYFQKKNQLTPHKKLLVKNIAKAEFIITSTETEAVLLEANLIKKHQPPYNIDLKDDKNFLYIKITLDEAYPRVYPVRRINNDGAKYFGPFVSASSVRQTLHLLRRLFPHRNFSKPIRKHHLEYLQQRYPELLGPADQQEYQQTIQRITHFLNGHFTDIITNLKQQMKQAASRRQFEQAAQLRDKIESVTKIAEKQKIVSTKKEDQDIVSIAREDDLAAINLFFIRHGLLASRQNFILQNTKQRSDQEIVQSFIEQYYSQATKIPPLIIIPTAITNKKLLEKTFHCRLLQPVRGTKKKLLQMGQENAQHYLASQKASWQKESTKARQALQQLQQALSLKTKPKRIEVYDISNIQGHNPVGSMIVFTDGQPDKKWYRKFAIQTVEGINDPAMMAELLLRRFKNNPPPGGEDSGEAAWPKPDLVILDGGKGQLNTVLKQVSVPTPIAALAKKNEELFVPDKKNATQLAKHSEAMYLIQRMRDEAHRFAITFYRKKHYHDIVHSALDDIPGIGPAKKKKLITAFGSVDAVRNATQYELTKIVGLAAAKNIKEFL